MGTDVGVPDCTIKIVKFIILMTLILSGMLQVCVDSFQAMPSNSQKIQRQRQLYFVTL